MWVANELLFQGHPDIEEERQKMVVEKAKLKKKYWVEIESLKDAAYAMFKEGFDESTAQVKYFNGNALVDFSKVDREKKLKETLGQQP